MLYVVCPSYAQHGHIQIRYLFYFSYAPIQQLFIQQMKTKKLYVVCALRSGRYLVDDLKETDTLVYAWSFKN